MCGIAGHVNYPVANEETVRRMTRALRHRGPDGDGYYVKGAVALGHRRLSIIDLEGGAQPMFNEDHSVAVVFNGEIYNYKELLVEIGSRHTYRTASDTEAIVHLYEELGDEMVHRLRGMFSFALWDERRQRLFAARDRFGEKPFVYTHGRAGFHFASEIDGLAAGNVELGSIDRTSLSDFLEFMYVPAPRSIYSEVRKLPAGSALALDANGLRTWRYWSPPAPGSKPAPAREIVPHLRECLRDAVRLQLRSDVPIAALLSGGLDSSTIVALMARELGPGVRTFSVGFGRADDELPAARLVAERYQTDHHEIHITEDTVTQTLEAIESYSEPFGDSSAVPTVAVMKEVAKSVKVVLSGEGGDEMFAGYDRYGVTARWPHLPGVARLAPAIERLGRLPFGGALRRGALVAGSRRSRRYRALCEVFSARERRALLGGDARVSPTLFDLPTDPDTAIGFDLGVYLPDDLLVKTDIAAMHWSLESRCPLLDHQLAEVAIPPAFSQKQRQKTNKLLLREAVADLLPPEIFKLPKRGFGSPVRAWLQGPLARMLNELLRPSNAHIRGLMDSSPIDRVIDDARQGRANGHQAWALLTLEIWSRARQRRARSE